MKKILLIDDQDWEFEILESAVSLSGQVENMQCRYASNPDEALALLDEINENLPDYIFLDVNLGGVYSSTELLSTLKSTYPYS
ncbi:MAG: Response regulator receiver domain, partial [Bacteroidota bacterium]|nr:Response regulator receiver domain [Bacteroidota bacterium]